MVEDNELKDMADKMELPLKEGAWEFIEAQIPQYPYRRRWILFWRFLTSGLVLLLAVTGLWYFNSSSSSADSSIQLTNTATNTTAEIDPNTSSNALPDETSKLELAASPSGTAEVQTKQAKAAATKMPTKSVKPFTPIAKTNTTINNDNYNSFSPDKTPDIISQAPINDLIISNYNETDINRYLALVRIKRYFKSFSMPQDIIPRVKPQTKRFQYFIGMNYGLLSTNIHIEPELMKLPEGKGSEVSLYGGVKMKKWNFSLGIHSAQFRQTTSMGDHHDTTYMQVFRPNFETVLPSEYVGRLHDTANLYLAGTNHNKVNQNFKVFGLSLNISRAILERGDFKLDLSYGANYKLLTKANTFFYDSINKAAVPFTQVDKGIVFKNLLSSRVRLAMNYRLYDQLNFEVAPFIDYFHKPFIKHYYKADLLNYGVSFGLNYTFK